MHTKYMEILLKVCNKCFLEKSIDHFGKQKTGKNGVRSSCKECHNNYNKTWRTENKERCLLLQKKWCRKNPDKVKARSLRWQNKNKDYLAKKHKIYREKNKEKIKEYRNAYRKQNYTKCLKWCKDYKLKNKENVKNNLKNWRKSNRDKCNASHAKRRSTKLQATPSWLSNNDFNNIKIWYMYAKLLKSSFDESLHVDHIVPLQGVDVCGLHVPWNLQILPSSINIGKKNRIDSDISKDQYLLFIQFLLKI